MPFSFSWSSFSPMINLCPPHSFIQDINIIDHLICVTFPPPSSGTISNQPPKYIPNTYTIFHCLCHCSVPGYNNFSPRPMRIASDQYSYFPRVYSQYPVWTFRSINQLQLFFISYQIILAVKLFSYFISV